MKITNKIEKKVVKELNEQIANTGTIKDLTEEQRATLVYLGYGEPDYESFSFYNECKYVDCNEYENANSLQELSNDVIKAINKAIVKAENYVNKNNLQNVEYFIECGEIVLKGYSPKEDKYMIKYYIEDYEIGQKEKEEAKKEKAEEKKKAKCAKNATVMIDGKKYKLVEDDLDDGGE